MTYNEGDLVKIRSVTGHYYAEVVGEDENGDLEVYYINRGDTNRWVWYYDESWDLVSKEMVEQHIPFQKHRALECFKQLGFRPLTENSFVKLDDSIPSTVQIPVGHYDLEEEDSDDDMSDFIVPDDEGEAFCPASPSSEFVRETHQLVHEYNQWAPKTPSEEKVKAFVDNLAHKYKQQDDERQFVSGKSIDYDHPPLPKQSKNGSI